MTVRSLLSAGLLGTSLLLAADHAAAEPGRTPAASPPPTQASTDSRISEVDACNQAQYQMPAGAVLQGFRSTMARDQQGPLFRCTVSWSTDSKAVSPDRPILFPSSVSIPLIWSGWL